jgi:hypothetical protein
MLAEGEGRCGLGVNKRPFTGGDSDSVFMLRTVGDAVGAGVPDLSKSRGV